jgi:protein tyrosine/serine phosphatase
MSQQPQSRRRLPPAAAVIVLVLAGLGLWSFAARGNLAPKNYGVVDEGRVYRAGQMTPAAMHRVIEKNHIKTIIDLGSYYGGDANQPEAGPRIKDAEGERRNQRVADALRVERYVMPLFGDGTGNANWYIHALRIMNDPAKQPVLVHCGAGSERTSVACALYEHMRQGTSFDNGVKEARAFRHDPKRNPHVSEMLNTWGEKIIECARGGGQLSDPRFPPIPEPRPQPPTPADPGPATAAVDR